MSYDPTQQASQPQSQPTQQVPPPEGYPPPYPPQGYPQQPYSQPVAPTPYIQYSAPPAAGSGFNFPAFWHSLGLTGQVAGVSGALILLFALFPWVAGSSESFNGFSSASGLSEGSTSISLFPYLWLVLLGAVGLIVIAALINRRRLSNWTATIAVVEIAGLALALEVCFLIEVNSVFRNTTAGAAVGFWLALLATVAALGVGVYGLMQQRKAASVYQPPPYADPYQQTPPYPGSQPYPYQSPGQPPYSGQ